MLDLAEGPAHLRHKLKDQFWAWSTGTALKRMEWEVNQSCSEILSKQCCAEVYGQVNKTMSSGLIVLFIFLCFTTFSGSLAVVINHSWHLLWHINALKFHGWVSHTAWCSRLSLYLHHHSPAEYKMNRGSSPTLRHRCISGMFSYFALMPGSDKPVYTLQWSSPCFFSSVSSDSFSVFCVTLFVSHCTLLFFFPYERRRNFPPPCIFTVCLNCWNYL